MLPSERERDQPLEIDLDLYTDLTGPGASDDLADTVDYGAVCDLVATVCAREAPRLLERLATVLAEEILAAAPLAAVTVAVRKLRPPVPQQLATSGVRITRRSSAVEDRR